MSNPQVYRLSGTSEPSGRSAMPAPAGVTTYVVDLPEIRDAHHPLFNALAELDATAKQFAADARVLVVVHKGAGRTEFAG